MGYSTRFETLDITFFNQLGVNITDITQTQITQILDGMKKYDIVKVSEATMYLADLIVESNYFKVLELEPDNTYINKLGNTEKEDITKYTGRGYIKLIGKQNYKSAEESLKLKLIDTPSLASVKENAAIISAWWWSQGNPHTKEIKQTASIGSYTAFQRTMSLITCYDKDSKNCRTVNLINKENVWFKMLDLLEISSTTNL